MLAERLISTSALSGIIAGRNLIHVRLHGSQQVKQSCRITEESAIELFRPRLNNTKSPDCIIYIRADKELIERLKRAAKAEDRPASQIAREGIREKLDSLSRQQSKRK